MSILIILGVLYAIGIIYSLAFLYEDSVECWSKRKRAWFWLTIPFTIWFMPVIFLGIRVVYLLKDAFGSDE